jgi:hypothetical protein
MTFINPFDPSAPEAESVAYGAGLNLSDPPADFDTPLPDGTTARQAAEKTFETWHNTRTAKGLPLFPTITAQAAESQESELKKAFGGLDALEKNLRPDQFNMLKAAASSEVDPEEYQARALNAAFLKTRVGRSIPPEHLSTFRDVYATQELGLTGAITDKAVYQAIQQRYADDDKDTSTVSAYSKSVALKMLDNVGKKQIVLPDAEAPGFPRPRVKDLTYSPTSEEIDSALSSVSERNRPQARKQLMGQVNELNRLFRKYGPVVNQIASTVDETTSGAFGDQESSMNRQVDFLVEKLPADIKERGVVLAMLANKLQGIPQEKLDAMGRMLAAGSRGVIAAKESVAAFGREGARQFTKALPFGDPNQFPAISDNEMEFQTRRKELLNVIQGQGMSLEGAADGLLTKGLIKFLPSSWMLPAAFHPIGQTAIAASMSGESIGQDRINNPSTNEGLRFTAGTVSGVAQAVIETLSNTTGAKIIAGKLPSFTGLLNKSGLTSPLGRGVLGVAAGGAATFATEYTEEAAQGATDLAMQSLASDLSGIRSDVDWTGYLGGWLGRWKDEQGNWQWKLGREQKDTLLAILPFALVGAGGAGLNHFRYGTGVVKNKSFLRGHGFTEAEIRSITATTDTAETQRAFRTAFEAAQQREPLLSPEEKDTIAAHRAAAIEELTAQNEVLTRAGLPRVEKERNGFTDQDQWIFIHPETDARQAFDSEDQAMGEWWNWSRQQEQDHLDTIAQVAEDGFIEHVTGEGMAAEGVNVDVKATTLTLPKLQEEMQTERATAEKDLAKATDSVQKRQATDRLAAAQTKLGWLKARIEAMVMDEGLSPAQAGEAFKNTIVAGRVFSTSVMDRIAGYTVQLFNGRNLQDVIEEFSEVNVRQALDGGLIDPEILFDDIRNYEKSTGRAVMDPAYTYDPVNPVKLIEGFSNLARAYALSQVRTGSLPPTVGRWIEMQTSAMAATVTAGNALSRDLSTAADLRAAIAVGNISPRLVRTIADSVGLDPGAQERRLQKQMEDQLAAEAMGGFPEIAEEARGLIPHPDTLRKENHPLAGEVRRLWESMKKPTKRRTKAGKSIDRTNEANAYFLPVGEMADLDKVRQVLNQKGFEFSTPTEMLDALDASISYGKPIYGTASNMDEGASTFSLGRSSVTTTADTRAFQGAEGSPSVIGPATFAIKAYHGTPHTVDKFSLDKIGSGEGAQAFGWGLYFAARETVADVYRKVLGSEFRMDGQLFLKSGNYGPAYQSIRADLGDEATDIIVGFIDQGKDRVIDELNNPLNEIDQDTFNRATDYLDRIEATNSGNLYAVTMDAEPEQLLDWDKPLFEQPAAVQAALRATDWFQYAEEQLDRGTDNPVGAELYRWLTEDQTPEEASKQLLAAGIPGLSYLDGNSRQAGKGTANYVLFDDSLIKIEAANGEPVASTAGETFALSSKSIIRIEEAIAKKLTQGPDERAEFYSKLRDRLAITVLRLRETKGNTTLDATDVERERTRMRDSIAEARAIIDALPIEARGRVGFSFEDITGATTERGQTSALIRLIQKADDVLETVLVKQYQESFEKLADLAKPDLRQNKQLRGRLTPETQRLVGKAIEATVIPPEQLTGELIAKQAQIDTLEGKSPQSPEEATAMQKQLVEFYVDLDILDTFGALSTRTAAETAHAYQQLLSIYIRGRTARKVLDESRQGEINAAKREVLGGLPYVDQAKHTDRSTDAGFLDLAESMRLGLSSFHQVMEHFFPTSQTARAMQDRVRKADRAFTRAKLDAKSRFDRFTFAAFNLAGISARRKRNRILASIFTVRKDWNIQLSEGIAYEEVKLSEEQAAAILSGSMKVGWETDRIAMTSLAQALADFRLQRLKAKNEERGFTSKVIRFQRLTSRGTPGPMHLSDLQALYYLQLWDQEQYRPALDKHGFTEQVMEQIRAKLDPRAETIADFLRSEYDAQWSRLNPVYRALYGMDMPRIRNYAPGLFESLDSKTKDTDMSQLGSGGNAVNAMSAGFTKSRTHHMARPRRTNALTAYWSSQESTEYFIAYAEIVRDMRQIFRAPDLRYSLEGNFGQRAASTFSQWLDAIEVDGNFRAAQVLPMAEMIHSTLATQSAVGLAFNMGVLFKQLSASFGALMEMPTKDALHGMMLAIRKPSTLRNIWQSESVQQRILAGISPEDRRLLDAANASPSMIMDLLELGRMPIAFADAAFTTLGASIAYNHALHQARKNGLSPTLAESHALTVMDRVVTRTAQPATTQDKSMSELTAHGFGKVLFLFKSDPRQKFALATAAVQNFRSGRIGKGEAARRIFWGWMVYGLSAELMSDVWQSISRDDDDPERWDWKDYIAAMIAGPIAGVPMIGGVLEYIARATIGTKAFTNSANPLDAAAARIFSEKGIKSKLWTMFSEDEPLTISDVLTGAQQDTAALSLLLGFIPGADKLAIVPSVLRATRDVAGMTSNLIDTVSDETPEQKALAVVQEAKAATKIARDGRSEEITQLAATLAKLDATARANRLANLDKDTRAAVSRKLLASSMSPSEQALASLPKDARAAAIEKITRAMSEAEKSSYLDRLRKLHLLPKVWAAPN